MACGNSKNAKSASGNSNSSSSRSSKSSSAKKESSKQFFLNPHSTESPLPQRKGDFLLDYLKLWIILSEFIGMRKDIKMKKSILTAVLTLAFLAATPLNAQQKENLKQIEDYLNNIKTMQAAFVQTASNGNTAEGMLYIAKPNKIQIGRAHV